MVAAIFSRLTILAVGILYPAYASFKAVRAKSHRDYTKWMMYWIVFALFQATETFTDIFLSWLPLYYEVKILIVLWLALPITEGSKQLYRVVIHPFLLKHEDQIDDYLSKAGQSGLQALRKVSKEGINRAAATVVTSAMKGQAVITEALLKSQNTSNSTDGSSASGAGPGMQVASGGNPNGQVYLRHSEMMEPFEVIEEETSVDLENHGAAAMDYQQTPEELKKKS